MRPLCVEMKAMPRTPRVVDYVVAYYRKELFGAANKVLMLKTLPVQKCYVETRRISVGHGLPLLTGRVCAASEWQDCQLDAPEKGRALKYIFC